MRSSLLVLFALAAACRSTPPNTTPAPTAPGPGPAATAPARATTGPVGSVAASRRARINSAWPLNAESERGEHAMVVSVHPLASQVGADILRRGGNAVDAAVAVGFALAVVQPTAGNLGGGGFMVIRMKDGTVRALDYRETAPGKATRSMYLDSSGNVQETSLTGHLSVGVPGSVAGMYEAHRKFGRLPWAEVIAPAIKLARDGHVLDVVRSHNIAGERDRLERFPASKAQFLVNGDAPAAGSRFVQADLGRTLQLIADSGPKVFYRGSVADLIVREMERGGGLITKDDLAHYRAKWRTPLRITYRNVVIFTMPPPGSGVVLAEMLNVLEGYSTLPPFGSAGMVHFEAEAMRRAYIDRNRYLGDPDFVDIPVQRLVSKSYAAELRAAIDPNRATPTPPFTATRTEGSSTTHYSVVDADGNAVSCTTTLNNDFGSAVTVTGGGFLLNDEMDDFASAPGKPNLFGLIQGEANAIVPGKRMLSSMTPSIVVDSTGQVLLVVGSPGGSRITTAVMQVISNVVDQGMPLGNAVSAPRLHHQALPDQLYLEQNGFVESAVDSLKQMGYKVEFWGYRSDINAIMRTDRGWIGVADPRRGGGAAGY